MGFQPTYGYGYDGYTNGSSFYNNNQEGINGIDDYGQEFGLGRYGDGQASIGGNFDPAAGYDDGNNAAGFSDTNYLGSYGAEQEGQQLFGAADSSNTRPGAYNQVGYVFDEPDTRFEHVNRNPEFDPEWYRIHRSAIPPNRINYLKDDKEEDTRFKDYRKDSYDPASVKVDRTRPENIQKLKEGNLKPGGDFHGQSVARSDFSSPLQAITPRKASVNSPSDALQPTGQYFQEKTTYASDMDPSGFSSAPRVTGYGQRASLKPDGTLNADTVYKQDFHQFDSYHKQQSMRPTGGLTQEGSDSLFSGASSYQDAYQHQKGERAVLAERAKTALRSDGPMDVNTLYGTNFHPHEAQKRIAPRHQASLKLDGDLDANTNYQQAFQGQKGERSQPADRAKTALRPEAGPMDVLTNYSSEYQSHGMKKRLVQRQGSNLRSDGDFDGATFYKSNFQAFDGVSKQKSMKNDGTLQPGGNFQARTVYGDDFKNKEGKKQLAPKQAGNLKQEGDFDARTNYQNDYEAQHEVHMPIKGEPRARTALRPEGDFDSGTQYKNEFQQLNPRKQIAPRPEGALHLEGDVQNGSSYKEEFQAHEVHLPLKGEPRAKTALKSEGSFESASQYQSEFQKMDNSRKRVAIKPQGALHPGGEFQRDSSYTDEFQSHGLQPLPKGEFRTRTALKQEGSFDAATNYKEEFQKMQSRKQIAMKPEGALRLEGQLEGQTQYKNHFHAYEVELPIKGEPRVKTALKPEGSFEASSDYQTSFNTKNKGAREKGAKPNENLKPEGELNTSTNYSEQFLNRPLNYQAPDRSPQAFNLHDNIKNESAEYVELSSRYDSDYQGVGGLRRQIVPRNKTALKLEGPMQSRTQYHDHFAAKPDVDRTATQRPSTYLKAGGRFTSLEANSKEEKASKRVRPADGLSLDGEHNYATSKDDTFTVLEAAPPVFSRRLGTSLKLSGGNFPDKSMYKEEFQHQQVVKRRSMRPTTVTIAGRSSRLQDRSSYAEEFQEFDRKRPTMPRAHSSGDLHPIPVGSLDADKESKRKGLMRILHSNNPHSSAGDRKPSSGTFTTEHGSTVEPIVLGNINGGKNDAISLTFTQDDLKRVLIAARATADARQQQAADDGSLITELRPDGGGINNFRRKVSV